MEFRRDGYEGDYAIGSWKTEYCKIQAGREFQTLEGIWLVGSTISVNRILRKTKWKKMKDCPRIFYFRTQFLKFRTIGLKISEYEML